VLPIRPAALGLGSQVAFQFRAGEPNRRGALNLYAGEPRAIDQDAVQLGSMFASQIAEAVVAQVNENAEH